MQQNGIIRHMLLHSIIGAVIGYAVLHPASLFIHAATEPCFHSISEAILEAFNPDHTRMALFFTALGGVFGILNGLHAYRAASFLSELRRSHHELEERVKERTAELSAMYREQRVYTGMLEQSNRELENFVHVATHDLQEPLRKIQTFADRMTTKCEAFLSKEGLEDLQKIRGAAGRMQALVLDLLKYSRITSNPTVFSRLKLRDLVKDVVTDLAVLFEEKEGEIEISDLPEIDADPMQMHQLFQNLITNSLKYRGERKPLVRIFSTGSSEGFCEIHVEDNGIGFDERYIEKIFKPFQRLHGKESPYEGTGMGLAICRRVVERHGGSITAKSAPGKGSTFIIRLPMEHRSLAKALTPKAVAGI